MSRHSLIQYSLALMATTILAGCSSSSLPDSASKSLSSHIDTSLTPLQRIAKVQSDPNKTEEQKATIIDHIKKNNHLN